MSKFKGKFSKKRDNEGGGGSFERGNKSETRRSSQEGKDRSGKYSKKNFRSYGTGEDGRRAAPEDKPKKTGAPSGHRSGRGSKAPDSRNESRRGQENAAQDRPLRKKSPAAREERSLRTKKEPIPEPPRYDILPSVNKGEKISAEERNIRLNKYIADAGICSRREADKLIEAGEIKVNGKAVTELGFKVSRKDVVTYQGQKLKREKLVYVLLNKPKDFITTMDDPEDRKTVMELVKNAANERIYPVGRLDRNTTGLLLLTNDGELTKKLSHPSYNVKKIYQVDLDRPITEEHFEQIKQGLQLEDGEAKVDDIAVLSGDASVLGVEIHIGRNRIVRRIFEHLGYEVIRLDRVLYAGLNKKDLPRGKWRYLTQKELIRLKHFK
jgi:23S rRNA pseudouridine2605 synthase